MNKIKGYANYGVLAHEKQTIFTISSPHHHASVSEEIVISVPDGWEVSENASGNILIDTPQCETYMADEIISSRSDAPVLSWYDGKKSSSIPLEWENV